MQIGYLESATWDKIREVLIIIFPPHQTLYQLQVRQISQVSNFYNCQELRCPICTIIKDYRINYFLLGTNMSTENIVGWGSLKKAITYSVLMYRIYESNYP